MLQSEHSSDTMKRSQLKPKQIKCHRSYIPYSIREYYTFSITSVKELPFPVLIIKNFYKFCITNFKTNLKGKAGIYAIVNTINDK